MCLPKHTAKLKERDPVLKQDSEAELPAPPTASLPDPEMRRLHNIPDELRLLLSADDITNQDGFLVWRLPTHISQSRFADRPTPSNACTIITLAMAELVFRYDVSLPQKDENDNWVLPRSRKDPHPAQENQLRNMLFCAPEDMLRVLVNGIVTGNWVHSRAMSLRMAANSSGSKSSPDRDTFTVPDAIDAVNKSCNTRLYEIDFLSVSGRTLERLPNLIQLAIESDHLRHLPRVLLVLIAFERAVLLVYERQAQTLSILDSHTHMSGQSGALIACCNVKRLRAFVKWMTINIFPEMRNKPKNAQVYEISCVQLLGPQLPTDAPGVHFPAKVVQRIFRKSGISHKFTSKSVKCINEKTKKSLKNVTPHFYAERDLSGSDSDSEANESGYVTDSSESSNSLLEELHSTIPKPPLLWAHRKENEKKQALQQEKLHLKNERMVVVTIQFPAATTRSLQPDQTRTAQPSVVIRYVPNVPKPPDELP